MTRLETARLVLRPASAADLEDFHRILSDERAMAYWSTPPHRDRAATRDWLAATMAIDPREGEDFVIERDGLVIGKAGLYRFPEIGFILDPAFWGQGYGREALRPVIDRAFAVHGLDAILADVDPRNLASLRLLARLGFAETGRASRTWEVGGTWCDSVYLRLAAPEISRRLRDSPAPSGRA